MTTFFNVDMLSKFLKCEKTILADTDFELTRLYKKFKLENSSTAKNDQEKG
jgi:hypothetical protein